MDFKYREMPDCEMDNPKMMIEAPNAMVMNRRGLMVRPEVYDNFSLVGMFDASQEMLRLVLRKVERVAVQNRDCVVLETESKDKIGFVSFGDEIAYEKVVMVHPSRTAETSMTRSMRKGFTGVHGDKDVFELCSHSFLTECADTSLVVLVARNPYDRIWSQYFCRERGRVESCFAGFRNFVMEYPLNDEDDCPAIWSPASDMVPCRDVDRVDFIVRFERLRDDFEWLTRMMGLDAELVMDNDFDCVPFDMSRFDQEMLERVNGHFHDDFENFGYQKFEERAEWWGDFFE